MGFVQPWFSRREDSVLQLYCISVEDDGEAARLSLLPSPLEISSGREIAEWLGGALDVSISSAYQQSRKG